MLDLAQIAAQYPPPVRAFKRNILREYLQCKILDYIYNSKFSSNMIFIGGTAIRIIHNNNRFSEDLDFDNYSLNRSQFDELMHIIKSSLIREGYSIEIRNSYKGAFHSYIRFGNLLFNSGLSGYQEEKLLIRIDTEVQEIKYLPERFILNKFDVFTAISVAPIEILLSQKILVILHRKRPMGRDFFDAVYLLGKSSPDYKYLEEKAGISTPEILKTKLIEKCEKINFKQLSRDIEPFVIEKKEKNRVLLFREYIQSFLL